MPLSAFNGARQSLYAQNTWPIAQNGKAMLSGRFEQWRATALGIDNLGNAKYWAFHPYPQRTVVAEVKLDF